MFGVVHRLWVMLGGMDSGCAVVTLDGGGVAVLDVVEVGGVLVEVVSGRPVELVSLVVVTGLPVLVSV